MIEYAGRPSKTMSVRCRTIHMFRPTLICLEHVYRRVVVKSASATIRSVDVYDAACIQVVNIEVGLLGTRKHMAMIAANLVRCMLTKPVPPWGPTLDEL